MEERYVSELEYEHYFERLEQIRYRIAADLPVETGYNILDLATGYGYFAIAVAGEWPGVRVIGIDLLDRDVKRAIENARSAALEDRVSFLRADATRMGFEDDFFDMAVNFAGLEDIYMTRGESGVARTIGEVARVLKDHGLFCMTIMPPEIMDTAAQKLEVQLYAEICGAKWLPLPQYEQMLTSVGFEIIHSCTYCTGRKLTANQAREEIKFACEKAPEYYGVKTLSFEEAWNRFGPEIEQHGLGQFSRMLTVCAAKR